MNRRDAGKCRLFLYSKNAKNGVVFLWRLVLPGYFKKMNSERYKDTEGIMCCNLVAQLTIPAYK